MELTYDEIDNHIDNLWSVLFTTGYLTQTGRTELGAYKLVIPNKEVREVYKLQIQEWFSHTVLSNTGQLTAFWTAVEEGNTESIEKYLNRTLSNSISVFDTKAPETENPDSGIIFELKYSREAAGLDKACEKAIAQMKDRRYEEYLKNDGRHDLLFYGVAFYKKRCKVIVEEQKEK